MLTEFSNMVRTYVRKAERACYGEHTMRLAMDKVRTWRIVKAPGYCNMVFPEVQLQNAWKTLNMYLQVWVNLSESCLRPGDQEQEDELCHHAIKMQRRFYGLSFLDLRSLAFQLAERNELNHRFCKERKSAGKDWALEFIKRRTELSLRSPEPTSLAIEQLVSTECRLISSSPC